MRAGCEVVGRVRVFFQFQCDVVRSLQPETNDRYKRTSASAVTVVQCGFLREASRGMGRMIVVSCDDESRGRASRRLDYESSRNINWMIGQTAFNSNKRMARTIFMTPIHWLGHRRTFEAQERPFRCLIMILHSSVKAS